MSDLVFTPIEASNAAEKYVDYRQSNEGGGMPIYIKSLDYSEKDKKGFLPVLPSEMIALLGRPGNGKTAMMVRWARMRALDLARQAREGNETAANSVVLYVTMEQLVEELRLFHVAAEEGVSITSMASGQLDNEHWEQVKTSLRKLHTIPLWFLGKSMQRRKLKIEMTEDTLRSGLDKIETWQGDDIKQRVDSIFIDYLQRFRPHSADWVMFYGDMMNALKNIAGDYATRVVVGVQARREVDARRLPIPQMEDGQWTSTIEQFSDGVISVVRPRHYLKDGETWDKDGENVAVEGTNQMLISVLKRKLGPENFKQWTLFDPQLNRLYDAELKTFNPNMDRDDYREVRDGS